MLIAGLIDHPEMGLVLFETGSAEDVQRVGATDSAPRALHLLSSYLVL